jgi:dihydroflavonol-4-reductase
MDGPGVTPYVKSKTIAEKVAWDFINSQDEKNLELTVINPSFVLGPSLSDDIGGTSTDTIKKFLTKAIPAVPNVYMNYVDVRDIAKLHVEAIKNENSNGKRFACTSNDSVHLVEIAKTLNGNGFPHVTKKIMPDFIVKFLALFSSEMKTMKTFLHQKILMDNSQTIEVFGWKPIPFEKTIIDMGTSVQNIMTEKKKRKK